MKRDSKAEARSIAIWWDLWTRSEDPGDDAANMQGAAQFAIAHALLYVGDQIGGLADVLRGGVRVR